MESIWESQPFDLLGVDSDNGGEFLNYHLYEWLKKHGIEQTRSRPCFKNDQAYVEQKNHTHVRQFLGYDRGSNTGSCSTASTTSSNCAAYGATSSA